MFPVANVPHIFHKYVLYNAKIVDKQEKNGKNEDYNYICYNVYLHYQNVVNKKYGRKEIICKDIARSIRFFRNGFLRHCRQYSSILLLPKETFHTSTDCLDMSNDRQLTLF